MATTNLTANPESLAVLTAMVNRTLIETGRFFRSSGSMQSRTQLKRAIPSAHEQFQNALDNLSEQIFIAKAFLEKDYEAIKAKKATPPPPIPAVSTTGPPPAEDVVMKEEPADLEEEAAQRPADQAETSTEALSSEQKKADEKGEANAAQTTANQQTGPEKDVKTEKNEETGTENAHQFTGEELNFDSMLPDRGGAGPNDFDLHLDFGNDEIGNQNFLSGANFLDSGAGNSSANGQGKEQGGSISSLLPGLESYAANATGEEFNLDLQNAGNNTSQPQAEGQKDNNNNQEEVVAPGGSSFDDLFMESENFGDGDDNLLGGDGLMDITELDDAWFN